jgi:hypothetical protein
VVRVVMAWIALAVAGCGMSVDGELPDIEVVQPGIAFPGVPADGRDEITVTLPVAEQVHDRLGLAPDAYAQVLAHELRITLRSGVDDLGFVRSLRISMTGVDELTGGGPSVEVARYDRGDPRPVGAELVLPRVPPADVTAAWRSDLVVITLQVVGTLPAEAWSVDVGGRFSAKLKY